MATDDGSVPLRVKVGGREEVVVLQVHPSDTMHDVAQQVRQADNTCCCNVPSVSVFLGLISLHAFSQVRKSQEWPAQQHVRFISAGQELFLDDSVSKALGSVLHCISSQGPAVKLATAGKTCHGQKGVQQSPAADWVSCWKQGAQIRQWPQR